MYPFVFNARLEARELFRALDPRLDPGVFLVEFPPGEAPRVGPDDAPFLPDDFAGVPARAVAEAAASARGGRDFVPFCGPPAVVGGVETVPLLLLRRDAYESHARLKGDPRGGDLSLIALAAADFLAASAAALGRDRPDARNIDDLDAVLLGAAKKLMDAPAAACGNGRGRAGLFDACAALSTLTYEGQEGVGRILFARRRHPHVRVDVALAAPVPLRAFGAARKLLQMGTGPLALLCDAAEVYGLGRALTTYDPAGEDVFEVRFARQFVWGLTHAGRPLLHVRYGQPTGTASDFPAAKFRADLPRVFPGLGSAAADRLCCLARAAAGQRHGCMLVISSAAADEAERLHSQCTRVEPFPLTEELMPHVTAIDGSVLVDTEGRCHAVGVILDGVASPKCLPERGSRYNSAVRYALGRSDAVAVVRSEDGLVSVLPDLRPRVRRSEVVIALAELRALAVRPAVEVIDLYTLVGWLQQYEFYLTPGDCGLANRLIEEARRKVPKGTPYPFRDAPLAPDPEMNASYYLPE